MLGDLSGLSYFPTQIASQYLREAPPKKLHPLLGHCLNGAGGLNACQDGLGHLFREELSKVKWAFPCFWGFCQDGLGHLNVLSNGDLTNLLKSARK